MPNYHQQWRTGCARRVTKRRRSGKWACGKRRTAGEIWKHALATGAAIITKDEDFAQRAQQTNTGPVIVWLCIGNASNQALRQWFLPQLPQIIEWIEQGVRVVEIR